VTHDKLSSLSLWLNSGVESTLDKSSAINSQRDFDTAEYLFLNFTLHKFRNEHQVGHAVQKLPDMHVVSENML